MRYLRALFLYSVMAISYFVGTGIVLLLSLFASPPKRKRNFRSAAHIWSKLLAFASGIPVKVSGAENMPKNEAVVIASNHQGAADILILLAYMPESFLFIIKEELFSVPLFGWYLRQAGYIAVERETQKGALQMLKNAKRALQESSNILIFPEGTRSPDGHLQEFKRGSLVLASIAKVRIVPVAISGSFHIMPKKSFIYNVCPVKLSIGKPITISAKDEGGTVRDAIAKML